MSQAALQAEPDPEVTLALRIAGAGAAAVRDIEAETGLYRLLAPRVRRYGLRHLRDASAADDLMQQVMLLALDQLRTGRVREPERVVSFIFGSCRTLVLAMHRKESRREALLEVHGESLASAEITIAPRHDHERVARCRINTMRAAPTSNCNTASTSRDGVRTESATTNAAVSAVAANHDEALAGRRGWRAT